MAGRRFGQAVAIERAKAPTEKYKTAFWRCQCDCGTVFISCGSRLRKGATRSCGCLRVSRHRTHGQSETRTYQIWQAMHARCRHPKRFPHHGGRGISVCPEWSTFERFAQDMGDPPTPLHSIDRYPDQNGNYEKTNCRWATMTEQANNKTNNARIEAFGEVRNLSQWAKVSAVNRSAIRARLNRGMSPEDAIASPPQKPGPRRAA